MDAQGVILDIWLKGSMEAYPAETARFLSGEDDPFRNPVGHTLKENLAILLRGLLEDRDPEESRPAIEAIVRLRAVQNMTVRQALGFIFLVRPILRARMPGYETAGIDAKVDLLAMTAFEEYVRCREQLAELRVNETRRAMALTIARSQGCDR